MTTRYFLLPSLYDGFEIGSIFKADNGVFIDLDSNTAPKYDRSALANWSELQVKEKNWLIKKKLSERIISKRCAIFDKIAALNVFSICLYEDRLCTISTKADEAERILFTIKFEDGKKKEVSSEDIDLCTDANSKEMIDIMKLLLERRGDVQKVNQGEPCILAMAYKLHNKSYIEMLLNSSGTKLDISRANVQALITSITHDNDKNVLEFVLQKCNIQPNNNEFLVNLAIEALRANNNDLLTIIFKFAQGIALLANGETFLTNLFKVDIDKVTIKRVVEMGLFDVNLPNKNKETALTLACLKVYTDLVQTLFSYGANAGEGAQAVPAPMEAVAAAANVNIKIGTTLDFIGQIVLEIMRLLVTKNGNIVALNENNSSILSLSYNLPNKRLFNVLVDNYKDALDLLIDETGKTLLSQMVIDKEMKIFKRILDKCVFKDAYEVFLLNLALVTLKKGFNDDYKMIVVKCKNRDRDIKNGEIFLTCCFKENIAEDLICNVILSDYFKIDESNKIEERAILLACERLMAEAVRVLLIKGCDTSYKDYRSIDIVSAKGNMPDNAEKRKASKKKILDMICGKDDDANEKLKFDESGFVNMNGKLVVNELQLDFRLNDPIKTYSKRKNAVSEELTGEVKWFGIINQSYCVGIELDRSFPFCMDGVINPEFKFECTPGHGVLTTIENVKLNHGAVDAPFLPEEIINSQKFIKCQKHLENEILKRNGIQLNEIVLSRMIENGMEVKHKGILKWFGTMNNVAVGVVELEKNHPNGTNGLFWRQQVIKCKDKRAIALRVENILKYIPFERKVIPIDNRPFVNIDVNSPVICYRPQDGVLQSLYGTVRWTGMDETQDYVYGIELDDEDVFGTDGTFLGQNLFHCKDKYGIVISIHCVTPNGPVDNAVNNIPPTNASKEIKYCLPSTYFRGKPHGIQGRQGSSFLDSLIFSLFSNTDCLDYLLLYVENDILMSQIREMLSFKIVYPLRETGFVSFHRMDELRSLIKKTDQRFNDIPNQETNLDNFSHILAKLNPEGQLLSLVTLGNVQSKQMFLKASSDINKMLSSQQLLELSMVQKELWFHKIPSCLIMNIPIDEPRPVVFPSNNIEISKLCYNTYKKCLKCVNLAVYQCMECAKAELNIHHILFCAAHKCKHKSLKNCLSNELGSKSDVPMSLKAIICIQNGHSVSYVKDSESNNEWTYFNDDIEHDPANPEMTLINEIPTFLKKNIKDPGLQLNNTEHINRITNDSYIFVYINSTMTCY